MSEDRVQRIFQALRDDQPAALEGLGPISPREADRAFGMLDEYRDLPSTPETRAAAADRLFWDQVAPDERGFGLATMRLFSMVDNKPKLMRLLKKRWELVDTEVP